MTIAASTSEAEVVAHNGVLLDLSLPVFTPKLRRAVLEGWYEARESKAALRLVRPGQTVLEIGAGCGFISVGLLKSRKPERVICVEANPHLIPVIQHHHRLNGVSCEIFNEILAEAAGSANFYLDADFWASNTTPSDTATKISVKTTPFWERLADWQPDLIIIDIEGGEDELLALGLPDCVETVLLEVHERAYGKAGVMRLKARMRSMGFKVLPHVSSETVVAYSRRTSPWRRWLPKLPLAQQ